MTQISETSDGVAVPERSTLGNRDNRTRVSDRRKIFARPPLEGLALPVLLVGVFVLFWLLPASAKTFPTQSNLSNVLAEQSVITVLAIAALFPLITGHFDFSVAAVASGSSVVTVVAMSRFHWSLIVACAAGLLFGLLIGAINGLLVARLRLNAFVVTLGGATLIGGGVRWYTHGQPIFQGIAPAFMRFGSQRLFGIPRITYVVAIVALAAWYLHRHTRTGRRLQAVGSNPRSSRLVGIAVEKMIFGSFLASGLLSGVAGVLMAARTGTSAVDNGNELLFPALTAVFLGSTAIDAGRFNVFGTIVGVFFVALSVNGLTLTGAQDWVNPVFNGAALIIAVGLAAYLAHRRLARTAS